jgi:EamA domain-containing membrane protein RarD
MKMKILIFILCFTLGLNAAASVEKQEKQEIIKNDKKIDILTIVGMSMMIPAAAVLIYGIIAKNLILILIGLILFLAGVLMILISLIKKLPKKRE